MASQLSSLFVAIGAKTEGFMKGADQVSARTKKLGAGMAGLGGAVVAGMGVATKKWAEAGDEVQKLALKTGFSTEALSEYRHAAELSGAELTTVEKGVKRMAKAISDASDGMATYVRAFDKIGLSAEELMGLSPEQQFEKITTAIAGLEDPTIRAAVAQDLLGRAGTDLLPMLAMGTDGMAAMRQEAHDLGIVFDQEAADKAAELNDNMLRMKRAFAGAGAAVAETLAPILTDLVGKLTDIITKVIAWTKEHPGLTKALVIAAGALGLLLIAVGSFLMLAPGILAAGGMMGAGFTIALGPIGLIIAAIAAVIAIGILLVKNWDKVTDFFKGLWNGIKKIFWNVVDWLKEWGLLFLGPIGAVIKYWDEIVEFFKSIPEKIKTAFANVKDIMLAPFRAAIKGIENMINWLIEKINSIRVNIPDWVPGIGGKSIGFNIPPISLPSFKYGGIVPGAIGEPVPIMAHGGERFLGTGNMALAGAGGNVTVNVSGSVITERDLTRVIREELLKIKGRNTSTGL